MELTLACIYCKHKYKFDVDCDDGDIIYECICPNCRRQNLKVFKGLKRLPPAVVRFE